MKSKSTISQFYFIYIFILTGFLFTALVPDNIYSQALFQPNRWCSNFPAVPGSGALLGHASCVLGDTLYIAGGTPSGDASATFTKYSISGNSWGTSPPMPGIKAGGDLVAASGKIYYIGGGNITYTSASNEQYVYDPSTGHWSTIANIPTPVTGNVAESYGDSLIYCIAGGWDTYLTTVQVYRIASNTWTTATSLPTGRGRRSFAGGINGNKLFVACGYSNNFRNDFLIGTINPSNPLQISWQTGPVLAINSSRPGGTAIAGRFYVVLGETTVNQNGSDSIAVWDTTTASWTYFDGKPLRASNYWGVISASKVYCAGRPGIKVWIPGGAYNSTTSRPLDVFTDTCMTGCLTTLTGGFTNNNYIPDAFKLHQNYPNPFNPSTKIFFDVPRVSNVKITVYNLLGEELAVLTNQIYTAGTHSVDFIPGEGLSSGVYFYKLKAEDISQTKKMLFIK
jgi:hypothetical protein